MLEPLKPTTKPCSFCWCTGKLAALMLRMPLPLKHSMSSFCVFHATELALGSWNSSALVRTSYTLQLLFSSTMASFLRLCAA